MATIQDLLINEEFSPCRKWIENARAKQKTWNEINFACKENEAGLLKFLLNKQEDDFWTITPLDWHALVNEIKKVEELGGVGFIGNPKKPLMGVPTHPGSCWIKYKAKLENPKSNFTYAGIKNIETSSQKIISQLELNTLQDDPVRGMVVGNVQSGKTANMSGVMAMAADYGYNFFIVLTGTIDNLRKQTRERLIGDLRSENCNVNFTHLDYLSSKTAFPDRLQDLQLNDNSNQRYLTVCLKNSTRLKDLLNWLNSNPKSKEKLKVLLIDDEADQAGINTKDIDKEEQTAISRLIKNIVFGRDAKDQKSSPYQCMNYIGYTATPYANFLNESGNDTLYPKNFISLLNVSTEYLGPQQIFGVDGVNDGLGIINEILDDDIDKLNNDIEVKNGNLPKSLEDALLWFICTISVIRFWDLKRPVSMLIHTSQNVSRHYDVDDSIHSFFEKNSNQELFSKIEKVYNDQTKSFTIDDFKNEMINYNEIENIKDYPKFDEIKSYIDELLNIGMTRIELDNNNALSYSKGIHMCVDNCKKNPLNNEFEMRIVYPDKTNPIMKECPAFIIIGGATLSRGLTLEGLTTSYFLRTTNQADTLMQMGRWFGYRKNYELLSRVWLSKHAASRFNRLTKLDYDLRNELYTMELKGLSPKDYAPRLDSFPDYKLLVLTAKNKMQSSIEFQYTFYNKSAQTTWFYRDQNIIQSNYDKTISFLNSLGKVDRERINKLNNPFVFDNSLIWFDIDYTKVLDYIANIQIPTQSATFVNYDGLKEWFKKEYESGNIKNWTVIAGGVTKKINNDVTLDSGIIIHLQNRTRIEKNGPFSKDYSKYIDLNTISQSDDRLMDIDCTNLSKYDVDELQGNSLKYLDKRIKYASNNTPLLIVYIVDKDSGKNKETGESIIYEDGKNYKRLSLLDLNLPTHIVGYYLYIPYGKYDKDVNSVTEKLNYDNSEKEVDVDEVQD